ncbi:hypothetical protein ACN47E_002658 [Coniothyrium glycines]
MSKANIEQSLTGLLPTLNGPLPPELLELSLSLLTRSRSVAQSLKSDEEIARPYACAQLACERLKQRLNLPTITSRPPCPPRVYKKLYSYLSSTLPPPATPREPQTPRKSTASAPASARNTPKTPATGVQTARSNMGDQTKLAIIPEWVMSTIRLLVKAFDYPFAAPHIYTGVESIIPFMSRMSVAAAETPSKRPRRAITTDLAPKGDISDIRVLGLIAVIFLYVYARMQDIDISPDQYSEWREKAVNTLLELPAGRNVKYDELSLVTEELMPTAQHEGWLRMEWFSNISIHDNVEEMEGVEIAGVDSHPAPQGRQGLKAGGSEYIGLGTMMQDATDFLGERQKEDYKRWKAKIMDRIQEIETAS